MTSKLALPVPSIIMQDIVEPARLLAREHKPLSLLAHLQKLEELGYKESTKMDFRTTALFYTWHVFANSRIIQ